MLRRPTAILHRLPPGRTSLLLAGLFGLLTVAGTAAAADWPQWRYDAGRTAASPEELPAELHLQWVRHLPAPRPAWPKYPRLSFDASYQPVAAGGMLLVPSMVTDSLTAYDAASGRQRWRVVTGGPVRLAPVVGQGCVYFVSDDGYLYCVAAADGRLKWKFRGLPANRQDRKVLGNGRLISLWPARGGPVLADGVVYFAAGVWPFEGVFVCAVDAASGEAIWRNDTIGDVKLALTDHSMRQDSGLSPQGYLALIGGKLFVPSGRALPGVLDPKTGRMEPYITGWGGRDNLQKGCWYVSGTDQYFFQSGDLYQTPGRRRIQIAPANAKELGSFRRPVLTAEAAYFSQPINRQQGYRPAGVGYQRIVAWDLSKEPQISEWTDSAKRTWKEAKFPSLWTLSSPLDVHIKAGSRLYAGGEGTVAAIDPTGDSPKVAWQTRIDGTPSAMLAAAGRLFVVTRQGSLYAFGQKPVQPEVYPPAGSDLAAAGKSSPRWAGLAKQILAATGARQGHALVLGLETGELAVELARQSDLAVLAIDSDQAKVDHLRQRLSEMGLYGWRVAVLAGDPAAFPLPPYLADLIVSEDPAAALGSTTPEAAVAWGFQRLRPYGGAACLYLPEGQRRQRLADVVRGLRLLGADAETSGELAILRRTGGPAGAADWTHENGDAADSLVSHDLGVKGPLEVLWFGGAIDMVFPPWDFTHSRPPTPLVAGGRMFFQVFPKLHAMDIYTGRRLWSVDLPGVEPGAKRRNVPYVALHDGVYVAAGTTVVNLDPASGKNVSQIACPAEVGPRWHNLRIDGDRLIGTTSGGVACVDRHDGRVLWTHRRQGNRLVVVAGGGRVYCADVALPDRRGKVTQPSGTVTALAADDGTVVWQEAFEFVPGEHPAPSAAFSENDDVLIVACGSVSAFDGKDGTLLWGKKQIAGADQPILHRDGLVTQQGQRIDIRTGKPLAGQLFGSSRRGCTRVLGAEHLLTIRNANASVLDLDSGDRTYFRGIRTGCTNGLIPADGLLNAPDFAHGCACNYPVFTSFALAPGGEIEK